ncbi:metalloendoproteinase 2-MMP-like [Apium graveolens]|uniref:metalloendoproteinase 2-MMP-like n=1 Tax=Apium graveolens TaxID=4045 RepID=UPI003D7BCD69
MSATLSLKQSSLSCIFFLLPLLCSAAHSSPFGFLKDLQGSQKGDVVEGVSELKQYLKKFGYIDNDHTQNPQPDKEDNDHFDDTLESAIKLYQHNYRIMSTGVLDAKTVENMMLPRCGVPDIINGRSRMRAARNDMHDVKSLHTVLHYQFFSGSPKWPTDKSNLTYKFAPGTPDDAMTVISGAFDKWAGVTQFTFVNVQDAVPSVEVPDIMIGFYSGDHGDGSPFDGPYGVLAHASPPTAGTFHLDEDEPWSIGPNPGHIDMETVALHEIGHLLGLQHSSVQDAVMYPSVTDGVTKDLCGDDVQGIMELYANV